jgi:hypothetical protein
MYFRIEPICVVERASLNKRNTGHHGEVRKDWRPTFGTEIPINGLTTIASVVKGFESSSNRHCRFWNSYQYREGSSRLLLTMFTMAHPDEGGIGIRGISNLAAEAATGHLNHFTLSRLVSVADGRKLRSFSCRLYPHGESRMHVDPASPAPLSCDEWTAKLQLLGARYHPDGIDRHAFAVWVCARRICDIIRPVVWRCAAE